MASSVSLRARIGGIALSWLALAAVGGPAVGQEKRCPDGDKKVVKVSIAVEYETGEISVSPWSVEVRLREGWRKPSRVCWVVSDLREGDSLHFKDKDPESPNYFPKLQRKVTSQSPFANSGNPAQAGTWGYALRVVAPDGSTVAEVDPEVVIKGGG